MNRCETCMWGCFEMDTESQSDEPCEHYYADDNDGLDAEYIETMRAEFLKEWNMYIEGWN